MKNKFNYIEIVKILNALYREQAELAYQMIHNNNINLNVSKSTTFLIFLLQYMINKINKDSYMCKST